MQRSYNERWSLVALDLGIDTATPQGELMAAVLATFAQFERRLIGQRTKSALEVKRAQGVQLGRPRSIPDEAIARIIELRREGLTYRSIAEQLNGEGVPTGRVGEWHGPTVYRALKSRDLLDSVPT
jgi:DNA invertase Pin-like site-specific DNA recombinase